MRGFWARLRRGQRGQSLVELAISMPLLATLTMGVIDLSFVLYAHVQVAAASHEAARAGALFPGDYDLVLSQNDADRATAVQKAVYDTATTRSALGRLYPISPNFSVATDVQVTYPAAASTVTRQGDEMIVTVVYRQPVWFAVLGQATDSVQVGTSTRVRIQ